MDIVFSDIRWIFSHDMTSWPTDALITSSGRVRCVFGCGEDEKCVDWQLSDKALVELNAFAAAARELPSRLPFPLCDGPVGTAEIVYLDGSRKHFEAMASGYGLINEIVAIPEHDPRRREGGRDDLEGTPPLE